MYKNHIIYENWNILLQKNEKREKKVKKQKIGFQKRKTKNL